MKGKFKLYQPHDRWIAINEGLFPKGELQADTWIGTKQLAVCFKRVLVISVFLVEASFPASAMNVC